MTANLDSLAEKVPEVAALLEHKQPHLVVDDDDYYSCPKSGRCTDDAISDSGECYCGADHHNAFIDAALTAIADYVARLEERAEAADMRHAQEGARREVAESEVARLERDLTDAQEEAAAFASCNRARQAAEAENDKLLRQHIKDGVKLEQAEAELARMREQVRRLEGIE